MMHFDNRESTINGSRRRTLIAFLISSLCITVGTPTFAQSLEAGGIPGYLAIARELAENVKPEDNQYQLGRQFISLPGDAASNKYAMRADCSGFLLAIFERAKLPVRSRMVFLYDGPQRKRPASEDFVFSIEQEKGFRLIRKVEDLKPGDLLAHAMIDKEVQKQTGTTGHVFLINTEPKAISSRRPIVAGTRQFEVSVIDSNEEHVGADDSRLAGAKKIHGLGKGTIRLYADDNGELVGWARTFANSNRFFSYSPKFPSDTKLRKAAMGRPIASI